MKNIQKLITIFIITIMLNSCGDDTSFKDTISIVDCSSSNIISDYTIMRSGDILVSDKTGSIIKTYHDENENKRVCVEQGASHISRW